MKLAALFWLGIATASAAQPMDGESFDAFSRGTTLYFADHGQFFGSEQFFSGHRTVWRSNDGTCINGKWAEINREICFVYDNGSGPFCWAVEEGDSGITVTSRNAPDGEPPLVLELTKQNKAPIRCTGPLFGV